MWRWHAHGHAIDAAPMTRPMPHAACGVNQSSFVDHITVGCGKIQHASDRECGATGIARCGAPRGPGARAAISCDGRRSRDAAGAGARGHDARDGGAGRGAGKASERTHCG